MRARWYDPATGSFLTTDPLGPAGGDLDPYGYAGRDPVNELDPTGFCRFGLTDRQFYGTVAAYADFEAAVTLDVAAALQFTAISAFSLTGVTAGIIAVEGAATLVLSLVPWYATYRDIEHAWS